MATLSRLLILHLLLLAGCVPSSDEQVPKIISNEPIRMLPNPNEVEGATVSIAADEQFEGCEFELGREQTQRIIKALENRTKIERPTGVIVNYGGKLLYCMIRFHLEGDDRYAPQIWLNSTLEVCFINHKYEVDQSSVNVLDEIIGEARPYVPWE